jgi:hypothetical protein
MKRSETCFLTFAFSMSEHSFGWEFTTYRCYPFDTALPRV